MIIGGSSLESFKMALALEAARRKPRPFAAFRGDFRKPVKSRAEAGQAGRRRLMAMQFGYNVKTLDRAFRILARVLTDEERAALQGRAS